jgi:hypothetical protein
VLRFFECTISKSPDITASDQVVSKAVRDLGVTGGRPAAVAAMGGDIIGTPGTPDDLK